MNRMAILLAFLTLLASAFAISATPVSSTTFYLEAGTSASQSFDVSNPADSRDCVLISTTSPDDNLLVSVSHPSFCLNARESTRISINITARTGITSGTYSPTVAFQSNSGTQSISLTVNVNLANNVSIGVESTSICRTEREISVRFTNLTQENRTIAIYAVSESLLPSFETETLTLTSGQTKTTMLRVNPNNSFPPGDYNFTVYARDGDQLVSKNASVKIQDCESLQAVEFELDGPDSCPEFFRGDTKLLNVALKNKSNRTLDFNLDVTGPLEAQVQNQITVSADSNVRIPVTVSTNFLTPLQKHTLQFTAATAGTAQTVSLCITVTESLNAELLQNNLLVEQDRNITVSLLVSNKATRSRSVTMTFEEIPEFLDGRFSIRTFTLSGNRNRNVTLTIDVPEDAPLGPQSVTIKTSSEGKTILSTLYFFITAKRDGNAQPPTGEREEKFLEFQSYPSKIEVASGQARPIFFTVTNTHTERLEDISIQFENLPSYMTFEGPFNVSVNPGQSVNLAGVVRANSDAPEAIVRSQIVVSNPDYFGRANTEITVTKELPISPQPGENPLSRFFTGLIVFFGDNAVQIGFWILVIIVVLLLLNAIASNNKPPTRHVWMTRK